MNKPIKKQLNFINTIEKTIGIIFDGKTFEDAKKWISDHIDEFNNIEEYYEDNN